MNCNNRSDQHRYNRRLFLNDNLPVMQNLDSAMSDAIITDPPFNSNRFYEHNFGSKTTDKKGKKRPGFKDSGRWTPNAPKSITSSSKSIPTSINSAPSPAKRTQNRCKPT